MQGGGPIRDDLHTVATPCHERHGVALELGDHLLPVDADLSDGFTGNMGPWAYKERREETDRGAPT